MRDWTTSAGIIVLSVGVMGLALGQWWDATAPARARTIYLYATPPAGARPVYRFFSPAGGSHFFTIDPNERQHIQRTWPETWHYEGVAFYAWPAPAGTGDPNG
jgi:hypothetical protein